MHNYSERTNDIEVIVTPAYVADKSDPQQLAYLFSYQVEIINHGHQTVQLLSRHWIITDGNGRMENIKGPGVIGEQPTLVPGAKHTYQSFCPLHTPQGNMRGTYQMRTTNNETFEIKIPLFFLRSDLGYH